jgi:hypothetical protein
MDFEYLLDKIPRQFLRVDPQCSFRTQVSGIASIPSGIQPTSALQTVASSAPFGQATTNSLGSTIGGQRGTMTETGALMNNQGITDSARKQQQLQLQQQHGPMKFGEIADGNGKIMMEV